ncbi:MAG: CHRD domain-containing protein, partial [Bacteroidia bacterium]|nr:CHRD domain-containing protein [Bacteroidia bacterium]
MKLFNKFLAISIILTGLISCKKDNAADPNVVFKATLTGGQEAPTPNASTATGTATLTFN